MNGTISEEKHKEIKENMNSFMQSFLPELKSGIITNIHVACETSDGLCVSTYTTFGTLSAMIGMLEIAKDKFLQERRETMLRKLESIAPNPSDKETL